MRDLNAIRVELHWTDEEGHTDVKGIRWEPLLGARVVISAYEAKPIRDA